MRESPALVLAPVPLLSSGIEYLAMVELLSLDDREVLLDLDLPLAEHVGLGEMLDQVVNAVVSVTGLSDHVASKIPHLVGILSKVLGEGSFVAARGDKIDFLASLSHEQKGQLSLPWGKRNLVPLLHVLGNRNVLFGDIPGDGVTLLPQELLAVGILVPKDRLDLVRGRVVAGDHHNASGVNVALTGGSRLGIVKLRAESLRDFGFRVLLVEERLYPVPGSGLLEELRRGVNVEEEAVR